MKKRILLVCPFFGVAILLVGISGRWEASQWFVDLARSYKQTHLVYQDDSIEVSFVQSAHGDFYYSYFETNNSDGLKSKFEIDYDDLRWFDVAVRKDGARYYVSGKSPWRNAPPESYYDAESGELYSGFYKRRIGMAKISR